MYYVALLVALAGISVEAGKIVGNDGCCLPKQMTMVEGLVLGQVKQGQGSITVVCIPFTIHPPEGKIVK